MLCSNERLAAELEELKKTNGKIVTTQITNTQIYSGFCVLFLCFFAGGIAFTHFFILFIESCYVSEVACGLNPRHERYERL